MSDPTERKVSRLPIDCGYIHELWCASDMSHNFELFGAQACQNRTSLSFLSRLLEDERPVSIIEIGTYTGGLTTLFGLYGLLHDAQVYTFDIEDKVPLNAKRAHLALGVKSFTLDCFSPEAETAIRAAIARGKCFLFCDGGDKAREFNHFADLIKPGDWLFAHDFAVSKAAFDDHVYLKSWGWAEVLLDDIRDAAVRNNMSLVETDLCEKAALGVFRKGDT